MCRDVKRGRPFYRCLGSIVNFSKKTISENNLFLSNSLGSYQSEGETSRPPSGRRLTPIENAPLIPEAVVPSPPSGVVSLYHYMLLKHLQVDAKLGFIYKSVEERCSMIWYVFCTMAKCLQLPMKTRMYFTCYCQVLDCS